MIDHFINVSTKGPACAVGVNDVPLFEDLTGAGLVSTRDINEWILPEKNHLTGFIYWPAGKPFQNGSARVNAAVSKELRENQALGKPDVLVGFGWPLKTTAESYPYAFQREFSIACPPRTRLWTESEHIEKASPEDRAKIFDVCDRFRMAVERHDIDAMYDLSSYKFEDRARAQGFSIEELKAVTRQSYTEFLDLPDAKIASFEADTLVIESFAHGLICRITRGSGKKLIEVQNPKKIRRIDVYVAKINGQWKIVR